jgi:hypothetical protein
MGIESGGSGYLGAGVAGAQVLASEYSWASANRIAGERKKLEIEQINDQRERAGKDAARRSEEMQIRREQERQITAASSLALVKKEMQEQAAAEASAEYRGVEGGSVEAFKLQLTRENLAAMQQVSGNFNDLKNHISQMISDNWNSLEDTRESLDLAEEVAEIKRKEAVPEVAVLRLGQLSSILQGAAHDYKYGTPWFSGKETPSLAIPKQTKPPLSRFTQKPALGYYGQYRSTTSQNLNKPH